MVVICDKKYDDEREINYKEHFDTFSFPLSDFQKYAIEAIVDGQHTLVCAPTGSGKTLPAEFAIRFFHSQGKKLIYTTPIKALSNQKYYEFTRKYPDISIGICTGDIKSNPTADVLIMTTEILMNYLFNTLGNEEAKPDMLQFQVDIMGELGCVVFDEVHYINDKHRGNVWEQTILMLPPHVQMVMLSATIDAPERFASWCERGSDVKQVYLATTNHRIVPLTHYGFLTTTQGIFKGMKDKVLEKQIRDSTNKLITLQSEKGKFNDAGYLEIKRTLDVFQNKNVHSKRQFILNSVAEFLRDRDMLPAIAFMFSRKNVEKCAHEITTNLLEDDSKIPYIVKRECDQIIRRLPNYQEYANLPEYNDLVLLLQKGIGIHHSGMIPILREIVELFISKKYIKLLFATESFAIGLDCPIKTAIFTGIKKFDGDHDRFLHSHEYTQMAGRAGRRGIDTIGHVVHCNNLFPLPSMNQYKGVLCGHPQDLVSKFNVSYSVVLNMLKQKYTLQEMYHFVQKSMIYNEIQISVSLKRRLVESYETEIELKQSTIRALKTPQEVCDQYLQLESELKTVQNKKKKGVEKAIGALVEQYPNCVTDAKHVLGLRDLENQLYNAVEDAKYMDSFVNTQVDKIYNLLLDKEFIDVTEHESDATNTTVPLLTTRGIIAANLAEVHPLIMADCMMKWNYFAEFTSRQLVGFFSCFTDIRISKEFRRSGPSDKDRFLKERLEEIQSMFADYDTMEKYHDFRTGINYENAMVYDISDETMAWCLCENEEQCKLFIQTQLFDKEISVGDFTKSILKISIMAKEMMCVCELIGHVELLHKLSQIDVMILKYITVNQSLYV
jgi:superfamily II RNA helicase